MSTITVFESLKLGAKIRAFNVGEKILFVAKDLADALEYAETANMRKLLDDDEYLTLRKVKKLLREDELNVFKELNPNTLLVNESGLYNAIFNSTKKEAKQFKKWVTKEVLPSIRKEAAEDKFVKEKLCTASEEKLREYFLAAEKSRHLEITFTEKF